MALPSVVSPSSTSSPDPTTSMSLMSVQAADSPSKMLFDGMIFSNPPDYASTHFIDTASSTTNITPATTIFVDTHSQDSNHSNHSNHAHSCSLSSHSLHSDCQFDHSPYGPKVDQSPQQYYDQMMSQQQQQQFGPKVDQSPQQYYDQQHQIMPHPQHHQMDSQQEPGTSSSSCSTQQQQPASSLLLPSSPATSPQSSLELSSLQQSLEKNRESLKHKLSHRASIRELVCRGIYPSPRIPIGHVEQRRKLERAKTGDLLRHHIQSRPDREYLIGHNILHADGRIDFRIAARQKELKKCRLAENLNQHLVTRPGPLDLVDRNILEAPQQLHIALRAGLLGPISTNGKVDSVGPDVSMTGDPNSQGGPYYASVDTTTMPSPAAFVFDPVIPPGTTVVHATPATTTTAIPMILSNQQLAVYTPLSTIVASGAPSCDYVFIQPEQQPQSVNELGASSFSTTVSVATAPSNSVPSTTTTTRTKAKGLAGSASRSKTQTLKFHEYKGPPEVVKAKQQQQQQQHQQQQQQQQAASDLQPAAPRRLPSSSDAAKEHMSALINQQALYLKYQKYSNGGGSPPAVTNSNNGSVTQNNYQTSSTSSAVSLSLFPLSTSSTSNVTSSIPVNNTTNSPPVVSNGNTRPSDNSGGSSNCNGGNVVLDRMVTRQTLADLRVADLKSYCRQLGLPISGTKQTLVDRLDARLNASRQHNGVSNTMQTSLPTVPSHSSSALFFTDSNGMIASLNGVPHQPHHHHHRQGAKPEVRSEEADDVITISSSASSPGIVHDNESTSNVSNSQGNFNGFYTAMPQQQQQQQQNNNYEASNEQLVRLHYCVESQQRHIELLKAELQMERSKRMDDNNSSQFSIPASDEERTVVDNTPMSLDAWQDGTPMQKSNQPPQSNINLEAGQNGTVGVSEFDDIMDLIGSFTDVSGQNGNAGPSPFMMNDNILKSPSTATSSSSNASWQLPDFGLAHGDLNTSTSPMSPWLFDNDNLHFVASSNNNNNPTNSTNVFMSQGYGDTGNNGNSELFTQNNGTFLSRANFT